MSLKYEPASVPHHISMSLEYLGGDVLVAAEDEALRHQLALQLVHLLGGFRIYLFSRLMSPLTIFSRLMSHLTLTAVQVYALQKCLGGLNFSRLMRPLTFNSRPGLRCTKMCSGSEAGSYLRLIDLCITQLQA